MTAPTRTRAQIAEKMEIRAERSRTFVAERAYGLTARQCPICAYSGMFSPVKHKPEIWCPNCDSRPRHRLLKLWMDREMVLPAQARVVHFAAEAWVRAEMEARGARYQTADINDLFELQLDITSMDLADESVDLVMANHVLEHVDDTKALAEIHRVLTPRGQAVITVPIYEGVDQTYEDPTHNTPEARALHYGDKDHLRLYGRDFRQRFAAPGFHLTEFTALEPDAAHYGLHRGEKVFVGHKGAL